MLFFLLSDRLSDEIPLWDITAGCDLTRESSFELIEHHAFTGSFSWRLKGNHIRFRGRNSADDPLPACQPIPARNEQIERLVAALDFLRVWEWRTDYNPMECGHTVCDGMSWSFKASIAGRECKSGGGNAYPSFADPTKSSMEPERYAFLVFALRSTFGIEYPESLTQNT